MKLQNFTKNRLFCGVGLPIFAGLVNWLVLISVAVIIILIIRMIVLKIKKSANTQEKKDKIKRSIVYVIFLLSFIVTDSVLDTYLSYDNYNIFYLLNYIIPTLVLLGGIMLGEKAGFFNKRKLRFVLLLLILLFFSSVLIYKQTDPVKGRPLKDTRLGGCYTIF